MSTDFESTGRKTADQRKEILARAVSMQLARGGSRVESQSDFNAVIVTGKPVNHVLQLILTLVTLGVWAIVWIPLVLFTGEKRQVIFVDEFGNTSIQT